MNHLLRNNSEVDRIFSSAEKSIFDCLELADEFLAIYEKCPDKIKRKLVYQSERVRSLRLFFPTFASMGDLF